jgi:hypothetical protein
VDTRIQKEKQLKTQVKMENENKTSGVKLSVNQLLGITFLSIGVITLLTYAVVNNLAKK